MYRYSSRVVTLISSLMWPMSPPKSTSKEALIRRLKSTIGPPMCRFAEFRRAARARAARPQSFVLIYSDVGVGILLREMI